MKPPLAMDHSANSAAMRELLMEMAELSDKVSFEDTGLDARKPSFVVAKAGETRGVRFAAIPLGHEFTSLVLALLQVGGHPLKLELEKIQQIAAIDRPLRQHAARPIEGERALPGGD